MTADPTITSDPAAEIDRLNDVTDRVFQQIEQLISDLVDSREETRRLRALIKTWCDAHEKANVIDAFGQYDEACEALRKEVGR